MYITVIILTAWFLLIKIVVCKETIKMYKTLCRKFEMKLVRRNECVRARVK